MQAPPGSGSFDAKDPSGSILNMIQDGVYGIDPLRAVQASENLPHGAPGILQYLNGGPDDLYWIDSQYWGNPYAAVHLYNGGTISSQDLTREEYSNPKTKVYANDITSRLKGWDGAPAGCMVSVKCPGALRTADSCGSWAIPPLLSVLRAKTQIVYADLLTEPRVWSSATSFRLSFCILKREEYLQAVSGLQIFLDLRACE